MSNRTKEVIVKSSIVFAGVCLVFTTFVFPVLVTCLGYSFEEVEITWILLFLLSVVSCITMIILAYNLRFVAQLSPEKTSLQFKDYMSLYECISGKLAQDGFQKLHQPIAKDEEIVLYIQDKKWEAFCVVIIRVEEISESQINIANDNITKILKTYYGTETITNTINMISIFCVDRITPAMRKLLSNNLQQGLKNGRLIVGISFGGKRMYIARQKDGFAYRRYKKMRHFLVDLLEIAE